MKKFALLSALVLALGFTSCDNYEEPNPPAQSNPQESILKTDQVKVVNAIVPGQVYSLDNYNNNQEQILIGTVECATLPASYEFVANIQASQNDFETFFVVPSSVVNVDSTDVYNIYVSADDLNGVYASNVTKNPAETTLDIRYNILTQTGSQLAYVGGPSNFYGETAFTFKPFTPSKVIEDNYYLYGTASNWQVAQAVKFHFEGTGNVYDYPVFTLVVEITNDQADSENGWQFRFIPQSTFAAGKLDGMTNYGVKPVSEGALEGTLDEGAGNGVVKKAGRYLITLNLNEGTYKFESALEYLSVPFATGQSITASQWDKFLHLNTTDYVNYSGTVRLYQNWFLSAMPAMEGVHYMSGGNEVYDEETGVAEGSLVQIADWSNGTKMTVAQNGGYYVTVNLLDLEYKYTKINSMSIVGAFNGWNEKEGVELAAKVNSSNFNYSASKVHMTAGGYKFVVNHSWDVNYGGALNNIEEHGGDLSIDEEGDYDFFLDFSVYPAQLTVTKR